MEIKSFDIIQVNAGWRIWSFIRISAGDQVGWSELSDSNTCNESTVAFLRSISNLVIGSDVDKYSTLITRLRRRFVQNPGFSSLKPLAGVENALIDLFCKLNKLSAISLCVALTVDLLMFIGLISYHFMPRFGCLFSSKTCLY